MRKKMKQLVVGLFALAAACLLIPATQAKAYGLTQSNPAADSITISWEAEANATSYQVYLGSSYSDRVLYATLPATQTSAVIGNLTSGNEYYVGVDYTYIDYDGTVRTSSVGSDYGMRTVPTAVTGLKQERWYYFIKSCDIQWDRLPAADGFDVEFYNSKGKKLKSSSLGGYSTSASFSKLSNNMVYKARVRAVSTICGQTYTTGWSEAYCFTQPRIKSTKVSGNKLTVKWDKVTGATGYEIWVSTKPKTGYKKVKTVGKNVTSATIKKLSGKKFNAKKHYYVYVATVKKVGKATHTSGKLYYWDTKTKSSGYF